MIPKSKKPRLSPSALSTFKDCPRCFWLEKRLNLKRPRGIFPSLPGGMDEILKAHYDGYRAQGTLPPEVADLIKGTLHNDQHQINAWRNWRVGLSVELDKVILIGAIDDLFVTPDNLFSPWDFKTKGSAPAGPDYARTYYQHQSDHYAKLFEGNGMKSSGLAHFIFYSPCEVTPGLSGMIGNDGKTQAPVTFNVDLLTIDTDTTRAEDLANRAADCLAGPMPGAGANCEYCRFAQARAAGGTTGPHPQDGADVLSAEPGK